MEILKNYPSKREIRDVLRDKIPASRSRAFFKKKGVLLLSQRKEHIACSSYLFYLGYDDLIYLKQVLDEDKNYRKSVVIKLGNDVVYNDIVKTLSTRAKDVSQDSKIDVFNSDDSSIVEVGYIKQKLGFNTFLRDEHKSVRFILNKEKDGVNIQVSHSDRGEYRKVENIIENTFKLLKIPNDIIKKVSLDNLKLHEKILLFDKYLMYQHNDWRLVEVIKVSLKKLEAAENDNDCINDDDNSSEEEKQLSVDQLVGLTSAILEGSGLRENKFVQECLKSNFYFSSARMRYKHKMDAKIIDLELNFKGGFNEINIIQSGLLEDDKPEWSPYGHNEQDRILSYFQEVLFLIYTTILTSR